MLKTSKSMTDPAHDILRSEYQPLSPLFTPQTVAVIGTTPEWGIQGQKLLTNLINHSFEGKLFFVNPCQQDLLGIKVFSQLSHVPEPIDLAVIAVPDSTLPSLVDNCVTAGVKSAIALGMESPATTDDAAFNQKILYRLQHSDLQLLGPHSLGLINPWMQLNASLVQPMPHPGHVAVISQSEAFCHTVLDWSRKHQVGLSALVSVGAMLKIGWDDLISYLGDDPKTDSIAIYMESLGDVRSFLAAVREVAPVKPIVLLKVGRTEPMFQKTSAAIEPLVEQDAVVAAALQRCGVQRVYRISELLEQIARLSHKPVLSNWTGSLNLIRQLLARPMPADRPLPRLGYEIPVTPPVVSPPTEQHRRISTLIQTAVQQGRTSLNDRECQQILAAAGIPVLLSRLAQTEEEAVAMAESVGYPVALNKTSIDAPPMNPAQEHLANAAAVRRAYRTTATTQDHPGVLVQPQLECSAGYELAISSRTDPAFGPVIRFGAGGPLAEVLQDWAVAIPPLSPTLASHLIKQTKIYQALQGSRGCPPIDLAALEHLLVQFSQLVVEHPRIQAIEINPLLAMPLQAQSGGVLALAAQIKLHAANVQDRDLPKLSMRAYPNHYVQPWVTQKGKTVTLRPIQPEDAVRVAQFHQSFAERLGYFPLLKLGDRGISKRLTRLCSIDYQQKMVLVAESQDRLTREPQILAVGCLSKLAQANAATLTLLVHEAYQQQGLGSEILRRLVQIGHDEGLTQLRVDISPDNRTMQEICAHLGFDLEQTPTLTVAHLDLRTPEQI